jgi:hypothetical protein
MAEAAPKQKVIRTIAAFDMDETILRFDPLSAIFSLRNSNPALGKYTLKDIAIFGDFLWKEYQDIFNEGVMRVFELLRDNRSIVDHICIYSNNNSQLLCEIVRYTINKFIGKGVPIIDAAYYNTKAYRTNSSKSRKDLYLAIEYTYPGVVINKTDPIILFMDDDKEHVMHRQPGVISKVINPPYKYFQNPRKLVEFVCKYDNLPDSYINDYTTEITSFVDCDDLENSKTPEHFDSTLSPDYYPGIEKAAQEFIDRIKGSTGGRRKTRKNRVRKLSRKH